MVRAVAFSILGSLLAMCDSSALPSACDDLPWSSQTTHSPGGNGTAQSAYSWHIHYLHNTTEQETAVEAFQKGFCAEFAKYGVSGSSVAGCSWGPNYVGDGEQYICGNCGSYESSFPPGGCGTGVCTDPAHGPWSVCQNEFFVPGKYIDEVSAWVAKNHASITAMRHPNTGCQWGDHFIRAEFFGDAPEMCLWGLPCNNPGYGCKQGMCGTTDGTHTKQHASGCVLEVNATASIDSAPSLAATVKEYVALAPNQGGTVSGSTAFEWVELEYPEGVSKAADVKMTKLSQSVDVLGSWYGVNPGGVMLTAKVYGDNLYALMPWSGGNDGGCCADRLRIYPRNGGGKYTDLALDTVIQTAMGTTSAHASHTFDVTKLVDGTMAALLVVKYTEKDLGGALCDAIVGISLADGSLIPTASGAKSFNVYQAVGTTSSSDDSRFKILFSSSSGTEEWHGNGVQRFASSSGVSLLAFTHRFGQEAVVFKDPFTHADGGQILQRFGTPSGHHFGLSSSTSDFTGGVHNVWYTPKSLALDGVESITLFVNSQDGKSQAYEFALALREQGSAGDPGDDTVFATKYVRATCTFTAQAQGGARTIGNGVFLVASGIDSTGLQVVDVSGNAHSIPYSANASAPDEFPPAGGSAALYDPFIRVVAPAVVLLV